MDLKPMKQVEVKQLVVPNYTKYLICIFTFLLKD